MTLYEKLNDKYREGKQKGDYNRMLSTVDHLLSKGSFSSEEEVCEFLGYDFNEYLAAKNYVAESEI